MEKALNLLERRIPPVAVFIITLALMSQLAQMLPALYLALPFTSVVALLCTLCSLLTALAAIYQFRCADTTLNPIAIHKVSALVETGVFGYSRNPMYLALLVFLVGVAYWLENWSSFVCCWGFVMYMNRFQIVPEERLLAERYGAVYLAYKRRVKRWLWW